MESIRLPNSPKISSESNNTATFEIKPCFPGYGVTLGNSLRRVLLSSLEGYAIRSIKIDGAEHEFSTIDGVLEDVIEIILNLKKVRFEIHDEEEISLSLSKKGEGRVTAADFKAPSNVKIVNPDAYIANITDSKASLNMEVTLDRGLGYVPTEDHEDEDREIGRINIDSIYTPVSKVSYEVSKIRVGKRTDYNNLSLTIQTDGSITPEEAYNKACGILIEHFQAITSKAGSTESAGEDDEGKEDAEIQKDDLHPDPDFLEQPVDRLEVSTRISNALIENNIKTIKALIRKDAEQLAELEGLGDKGVKEIADNLKKHNLSLKE